MGDKDLNELFGKDELLIGDSLFNMKPLPILENGIKLKESVMQERIDLKSLIKPLSFKCKALFSDDMAKILDADIPSALSRRFLMVQWPPTINKPRNLKYPNKKRAWRVWKKWAKRYGISPGKTINLPV